MTNIVEQIDQQLADLLAGWNMYSTIIAVSIFGYLTYTVVNAEEPDTHPMLLQRQATASMVRKPGESAIYRSSDTPHGFPLRSGLNVKEPGAPAYAGGKDGDLRDIWRRVTGEIPLERPRGSSSVSLSEEAQGKIFTVFGKEEVTEHSIPDITKELTIIGSCIKKQGATRVAIYMPNSVEFLAALFACSFFGLSPVLIPFNQSHSKVIEQLAETKADALVAQAGSLPLEEVSKAYKSLKQVIWVVEKTSRHMDWTEVPKDVGDQMDVSMWHQLVRDHQDITSSAIPDIKSADLPNIVTIWLDKPGSAAQVVEFTHKNLVAGIGALLVSVPLRQRLSPSDLFLSADAWTSTYPLCWTLGALFSHCSVAITSVAGPGVSLALTTRCIAPTVIVASAESAERLHAENKASASGGLKGLAHSAQLSALDAGRMPSDSLFSRINSPHRVSLGTTPGKLRLLFISERAGAETPPLSSQDLSDLRIFTNARVVYALTAARVAGAVAQTSVYDYRRETGSRNKHSHFGAPLSSVELKVVDSGVHKTTDEGAKGEIVVAGPSVAGGEARLGVVGKFNDDCTIAYI
ncbi:uncharacterized protein PV09_02082 [Verruconis gallopava]|uniref:AMP-dependent synthetase/ligase domain-containing protein n=1 Tax=Verruconis gallopava TaxID=253628 RepID=A0A0D2B7J3_9PEZI|nr:uncharacterized protein PV09_02082 [Verruconis gallopava]KIW07224.1 hypothetical protein PV09_02082 [Verruconis gallopava]